MTGLNFIEGVGEAQLMRTVVQAEKDNKGQTVEMARALATLGGTFLLKGRHTAAEPLLERALAVFTLCEGKDGPGTVEVREHLLGVYQATGHSAQAEELTRCTSEGELPGALQKWVDLSSPPPSPPPAGVDMGVGTPDPIESKRAMARPSTVQSMRSSHTAAIASPSKRSVTRGVQASPDAARGFGVLDVKVLAKMSDTQLLAQLQRLEKENHVEEIDTARVLHALAKSMITGKRHVAAASLLERAVELFVSIQGAAHPESISALQALMELRVVLTPQLQRSEQDNVTNTVTLSEVMDLRAEIEMAEVTRIQAEQMRQTQEEQRDRTQNEHVAQMAAFLEEWQLRQTQEGALVAARQHEVEAYRLAAAQARLEAIEVETAATGGSQMGPAVNNAYENADDAAQNYAQVTELALKEAEKRAGNDAPSREAVLPGSRPAAGLGGMGNSGISLEDLERRYAHEPVDEERNMPAKMADELGPIFYTLSRAWGSRLLHSKGCTRFTDLVVIVLVVTACIIPPNPSSGYSWTAGETVSWVFYILAIIYSTVEVAIRAYSMGIVSFLQLGYNLLDVVVISCSWPSIVISSVSFNIGALRAFRLLKYFDGVQDVLRVIVDNRSVLANLVLLLVFLLTMICIVAIENLGGSLDNWCTYNGELALPVTSCSTGSSGFNCASATATSVAHTCDDGSFGYPQNGHATFNNFGQAFLLNYQFIAHGDLWYYVGALDAEMSNTVLIYLALVLLVFSLFLNSLFSVAVVTGCAQLTHDAEVRKAAKNSQSKKCAPGLEPDIGDNGAVTEAYAVAERLKSQGRIQEAQAIIKAVATSSGNFTDEWWGIRAKCGQLVKNPMFEGFVLFIVVLNACLLASQHNDQPDWWGDVLTYTELAFNILFTVEALVKIIGLGTECYFGSRWDRFDFVILILSWIAQADTNSNLTALRAFRCFRALRIGRMLKNFPSILGSVRTLFTAVSTLADLCIITASVVVFFAIAGFQLFGNLSEGDERSSTGWGRANFDTWGNSVLVMMKILTNDRWDQPMYDMLRTDAAWATGPFFVMLSMFGQLILFNLFLGAMIQAIARSSSEGNSTLTDVNNSAVLSLEQRLQAYYTMHSPSDVVKIPQLLAFYAGNEGPLWSRLDAKYKTEFYGLNPHQQTQLLSTDDVVDEELELDEDPNSVCFLDKSEDSIFCCAPASYFRRLCVKVHDSRTFRSITFVMVMASCVLLFLDGPDSERSSTLNDIDDIGDAVFLAWWTLELVVGSIAHGFLWTRTDYGQGSKYAISRAEARNEEAQLEIKTGETAVHPESSSDSPRDEVPRVSRDAWLLQLFHNLDFVALLLAWTDFVLQEAGVSWLKIGRVARPLRVFSVIPPATAVLQSLMCSMRVVQNVFGLFVAGTVVFGIMGLQLLCGMLESCSDSTVSTEAACVGFMAKPQVSCSQLNPQQMYCGTEEFKLPRVWSAPTQNFNNLGESLLTLLEVATLRGWSETLYRAIDVSDTDETSRSASWYMAVYLFAYIIFASLLMMQLCAAVVIDSYTNSQAKVQKERKTVEVGAYDVDGDGVLSAAEIQHQEEDVAKEVYEQVQRMVRMAAPFEIPERPSHSAIRTLCFDLCIPWDTTEPFTVGVQQYLRWVRHYFEPAMLILTMVNVGFMASKHYGQSDSWRDFLFAQDCVFLAIFALEAVIKMTAVLPIFYFKERVNLFDFIIVLGALISMGFPDSQFMSIFRALRVVRVALRFRGTQSIFLCLVPALKPMCGVLVLLLAVFAMYARLGMYLFSDVRYGVTIGRDYNFESFRSSAVVLWYVIFGDRWIQTSADCGLRPPECTYDEDCGSSLSSPYFLSFVISIYFLVLKLGAAVVMEGYAWMKVMQDGNSANRSEVMQYIGHFSQVFQSFDPSSQGSVPLTDMEEFVIALGEPLGRSHPVDPAWLQEIVEELDLLPTQVRGHVVFIDVWNLLTTRMLAELKQRRSSLASETTTRPVTRGDVSFKVAPEPEALEEAPLDSKEDVAVASNPLCADEPTKEELRSKPDEGPGGTE